MVYEVKLWLQILLLGMGTATEPLKEDLKHSTL